MNSWEPAVDGSLAASPPPPSDPLKEAPEAHHTPATSVAQQDDIERLSREVAELKRQVAALAALLPTSPDAHPPGPAATVGADAMAAAAPTAATRTPWSRRSLLLGGAAATLGGAASLASAAPAVATTSALLIGVTNDAGTDSTTLLSSNPSSTLTASNTNTGVAIQALGTGSGAALHAHATGPGPALHAQATGPGPALHAEASGSGAGVRAASAQGPAIVLQPGRDSLPTTGYFDAGSLMALSNGELWYCVVSGTPGAWRLLASPASAGALVPIAPARVHDSRYNPARLRERPPPLPPIGIPMPAISGLGRSINVANSYVVGTNTVAITDVVPTGARAVALNLTITAPTAPGYMIVAPGKVQDLSGSSINWTAAGTTIANALIVGLDDTRHVQILLQMSGMNGICHFTMDVNGYFLGA